MGTSVTNGTRADFITLGVRTGDPGYGGISLLTFPTDTKGFSVSKKLDKIGNLSSDTAILFFEDCRVPARYVLGEENEGFYHIMISRGLAKKIDAAGMTGNGYVEPDRLAGDEIPVSLRGLTRK